MATAVATPGPQEISRVVGSWRTWASGSPAVAVAGAALNGS